MRKGQCSCGDLAFEAAGEPFNSVFCYCKACQIASGSDKFYGVWYQSDQYKITKGQASTYQRQGDSGGTLAYHFCHSCGTTVSAKSSYGMVSVAGATLDNTDGIEPKMAIFTESAPHWALLPSDIPCFDKMPEKNEIKR